MTSIAPVSAAKRTILANLLQLYLYDWSELGRGTPGALPARFAHVGDDGRFAEYPLDPYFLEVGNHPLFIRHEEQLAGFALVRTQRGRLGGGEIFDMAEFFILRTYRRLGVGLAAARLVFDRFEGPWEVRQRHGNEGATAFWRRAIEVHTGGDFVEVIDGPAWKGTMQRFG